MAKNKTKHLQNTHAEEALPDPLENGAVATEGVLDRAFLEIHANLEEMRVAEEALRVQNEELARARRTIEQEQQRYQDLFDFAPDAYIVTNDLGVIQAANRASASLFGIDSRFLRDKPLITFIPGEERLAFRQLLSGLTEISQRKQSDFHVRPRKRPDVPVSITVAVAPNREGGTATLLWMLRDVSERVRAQEESIRLLKEQQARRQREEALAHLEKVHLDLRTDLEREQFVSHTLQTALLPAISPEAFAGVTVTTAYQPAFSDADVGGDFYDAFTLPDGRVALVVGDASGKGLHAATRTTEVKFALRAFLREETADPARAVARLNRYLTVSHGLDASSPDEFYALALAIVSPEAGAAQFVTAGCELPMILRADGALEECPCGGGVLGLDLGMEYETLRTTFEPGDTIVLLTDGVTESRHGGVLFGSEGVASVLQKTGPRTKLPRLASQVLEAANAHANGSLQDDICLMLARRQA